MCTHGSHRIQASGTRDMLNTSNIGAQWGQPYVVIKILGGMIILDEDFILIVSSLHVLLLCRSQCHAGFATCEDICTQDMILITCDDVNSLAYSV